jgi:hypothetical protein
MAMTKDIFLLKYLVQVDQTCLTTEKKGVIRAFSVEAGMG